MLLASHRLYVQWVALVVVAQSLVSGRGAAQQEPDAVSATPYVRQVHEVRRHFFESHWLVAFLLLLLAFILLLLALWIWTYVHFAGAEQARRRRRLARRSSSSSLDTFGERHAMPSSCAGSWVSASYTNSTED